MNKRFFVILASILLALSCFVFACKKEEVKEAKLNVSVSAYELTEGEETTLFYTVSDKKDDTVVLFYVADEKIVKVENDTIFALSKGDTTIDIYLSGKEEERFTVSVKVKEKEPEKPEVKIMNKINNLALFEDYNLISYISDKSTVVWTSSDEKIATVTSKGTLTGIKEGKVTITLSSKKFPEVKDEMEVEFTFDAWRFLESIKKDNILVQDITAYGATNENVRVLGSVSDYYFGTLNIIEAYGPVSNNAYTGKVANINEIMQLDEKGYVRPGIYLEELKYIVYHDTANVSENADAEMHNRYMYGDANKNSRARSWHYTVDDKCIYHNVPDNEVTWQGDSYDSYAKSIGIETCVNVGSDFYRTWQTMAKLIAKLLDEYGLDVDAVKQHYFFNQKDCPKTLRNNGLWDNAVDLIKAEYIAKLYLSDYTISFKSLSPNYLDDTGKVIKQAENTVRLAYEITLTDKDGNKETRLYHANLEGKTSTTSLSLTEDEINSANAFDEKVAKWDGSYNKLNELINEYNGLSEKVKQGVSTYDYLKQEEYNYLITFAKDSSVVINKIFALNSNMQVSKAYSYVEIKNISKSLVSYDLTIEIKGEKNITKSLGTIKLAPGKVYLIAFGDLVYNGGEFYDFIVPDIVIAESLPSTDFTVILKNGENVLDKVGLDNALDKENTSVKFESLSYSIARKQDIDTDDNERDFATSSILPTNTKFVQDAVLDFDYNVLLLNKEVTLEDEDALNALKASYDEFDDDQKKQATQKTLLDSLLIEVAGIKNPSLAVVKKALLKVPAQIVTDFTMPTADGLSFEYKNAEDSSIFNLETGEYSEVIHEYKPVVLVAKCGDYSEEFTVNFGICHEGDHIIYTTGSKGTPKGPTSDGLGTYEQHLEAAGFGGIAVRCEGKVFFIGKNCYIELDDSKGTALTRAQLRPYGKEGANDINNTGFVNGVVKEYTGTGVLYHNNSNSTLTFDLTDTYGRANAGSYGYAKCFFALNENNEYAIRDIVQHTGENFSTDNYQVELAPGEYLWCPHIYETNVSYGTWFIFPGPSAAGGMLEEGVVAEFIAYKLPENKN